MGVKHLQKLNVRCDDRDQIALVPPLQPGRAEPSQGGKHLVPDDGQQLKGNKMVAVLLPVVEQAPGHCQDDEKDKQCPRLRPQEKPRRPRVQLHARGRQQDVQQPEARQDGEKDGAQISQRAQKDRQEHDRQKRGHQAHKASHDPDAAAPHGGVSHLTAARLHAVYFSGFQAHTAASFPYCSFPYCSSSIWVLYSFSYCPLLSRSCRWVPDSATLPSCIM